MCSKMDEPCLLTDYWEHTLAKGKICKTLVDQLVPCPKDQFIWDTALPGFGIKITPKGCKTYVVQYRSRARRCQSQRLTIGRHGVVTTEEARRAARQFLAKAAMGENPAEDRRSLRRSPTLEDALNTFLVEHADAKLSPSTAKEYRTIVRLHITPLIGKHPLSEVSRKDVAHLHLKMSSYPYQANRALALLSKFFNWSERHGLRPDHSNPCRHLDKYKEQKRERFLSFLELERLGHALGHQLDSGSISVWAASAITLLLLTGARKSEILKLKWSQVDAQRGVIVLHQSKTGAREIVLSKQALDYFAKIPRIHDNPHVICGDRAGHHLTHLHKPWNRVRMDAGLQGVRIHDLRHTFASFAVNSGASLPLIGGLLGHAHPQTTARYAHLSHNPMAAVANSVGALVVSALKLITATEITNG